MSCWVYLLRTCFSTLNKLTWCPNLICPFKIEKVKILFYASMGYSYGCFNKFVKLGTLFVSGQVEINQLRLSLKVCVY